MGFLYFFNYRNRGDSFYLGCISAEENCGGYLREQGICDSSFGGVWHVGLSGGGIRNHSSKDEIPSVSKERIAPGGQADINLFQKEKRRAESLCIDSKYGD